VEVYPIRFETTHGHICFNVWDTAGQPVLVGIKEGYYKNANGCIAMYSSADQLSHTHLNQWIEGVVESIGEDQPIVVIQNKCDLGIAHFLDLYPTFDISTKSGNNLYAPFLHMARELMHAPALEFI